MIARLSIAFWFLSHTATHGEIVLEAVKDFESVSEPALFAPHYVESKSADPSTHGLAVDTSKHFGSPAAVTTIFKGPSLSYKLRLLAVSEEDGQSLYQIFHNGELVAGRRSPPSSEKRESRWLSFGERFLEINDRLTVVFRGHSDMTVSEGAGYAWSRGRWRSLSLSPTTSTSLSSSSTPIRLPELWTFESLSIEIPGTESDGISQVPPELLRRIQITNPYAEEVTPLLLPQENGSWKLRNSLYLSGDWHIRIGEDSYICNVSPGKPTGPLSRWSEDPTRTANGSDRPLELLGIRCKPDQILTKSIEELRHRIFPLMEAPFNFIRFTSPLFNDTETSAWIGKDGSLEDAKVLAAFASIEPALDFIGKRSIYLDFSSSFFPKDFLDSLRPVDEERLVSFARNFFRAYWNCYLPDSYSVNPYDTGLAGANSALARPFDFDHSEHAKIVADFPKLPNDHLATETLLHQLANELLQSSLMTDTKAAIPIASGSYPDLVADDAGNIHLVYAREGSLFYRNYYPTTEILSDEIFTGIRYKGTNEDGPQRSDPEIAIDAKGRLHVLCGKSYAIYDGKVWAPVKTLFTRDTALAIDSKGNAFVCKRGGNHNGEVGFDILPAGATQFVPSLRDPDVGTPQGEAWSIGKDHPYGHVFTSPDDTVYLVYRQGAPDYIAWRATRDLGKTWFGGGVYGKERWQPEAPSGVANARNTAFVVGPTGSVFTKLTQWPSFHEVGDALTCGNRDLPIIVSIQGSLAITSHGGRYAFLSNGRFTPEKRFSSPDGNPIGFVSLTTAKDRMVYAFFETGTELDKENEDQQPSGTAKLWLTRLDQPD